MENYLLEEFYSYAKDIIESEQYQVLDEFIQHGGITCREHCIGVAFFAFVFARKLKVRIDEGALVRGALLHDYFLYDWHDKKLWHTWHGFTHARTAADNAVRDYKINELEEEIIRKHMWPLNPALPLKKEAWLVTAADKYCSTLETLGQLPLLHFLQRSVKDTVVILDS